MVWEMEQHKPADGGASDRLSPLNLLYLRFSLALIASMFLIFISLTLHFEAGQAPAFLRYVSLALATGVMLLLAGPFLDNLKREISDRRLSLASLIFAGSGAAWLLSAWNTLTAEFHGLSAPVGPGAGSTYFETSAMILTFYVGSLLLDTHIKRGMAAYTRLWETEASPEVLKVSGNGRAEGQEKVVADGRDAADPDKDDANANAGADADANANADADAGTNANANADADAGANAVSVSSMAKRATRTGVETLEKGDCYLAEAGQPVLTDTVVTEGAGFVDESHLTGEPEMVRKQKGDVITAGSVSIDGGMVLQVTHPYRESSLQEYLRRARAMRSRPGYYERFAARGASILLVFVMTAAFGGLAYHTWAADLPQGLHVFLAVLLIGCPCAFSISTPAALWVANQRLHRSGVIAMGGSRALEKLSETKVVLFDKTGTLTEGVAVRSIQSMTDDPDWPVERLMRLAGGLEMDQAHPFAKALRRYLDQNGLDPIWPEEAWVLPGLGMEGRYGGADASADLKQQEARADASVNGGNSSARENASRPIDSQKGTSGHTVGQTVQQTKRRQILLVNGNHPEAKGRLEESELGLFMDGRLMLRLRIYQPPRRHLWKVIRRLQEKNGVRVAVVTGDPSEASTALPNVQTSSSSDLSSVSSDSSTAAMSTPATGSHEMISDKMRSHGIGSDKIGSDKMESDKMESDTKGMDENEGHAKGMDAAGSLSRQETDIHPDVDYHSSCTPERKAELVDEYRQRYGKVMFVGDGTNDLMAINKADLGVGVYNGTLSIRNHADFVLFHPNLNVIPEMLDFAGKITGTIRINFFWAIAYNFVGIGVALMGLLHPFFAIVAMMLSSIFVTLHSSSLQRRQPSLGDLEKQVNTVTTGPLLRPGVSET